MATDAPSFTLPAVWIRHGAPVVYFDFLKNKSEVFYLVRDINALLITYFRKFVFHQSYQNTKKFPCVPFLHLERQDRQDKKFKKQKNNKTVNKLLHNTFVTLLAKTKNENGMKSSQTTKINFVSSNFSMIFSRFEHKTFYWSKKVFFSVI